MTDWPGKVDGARFLLPTNVLKIHLLYYDNTEKMSSSHMPNWKNIFIFLFYNLY